MNATQLQTHGLVHEINKTGRIQEKKEERSKAERIERGKGQYKRNIQEDRKERRQAKKDRKRANKARKKQMKRRRKENATQQYEDKEPKREQTQKMTVKNEPNKNDY